MKKRKETWTGEKSGNRICLNNTDKAKHIVHWKSTSILLPSKYRVRDSSWGESNGEDGVTQSLTWIYSEGNATVERVQTEVARKLCVEKNTGVPHEAGRVHTVSSYGIPVEGRGEIPKKGSEQQPWATHIINNGKTKR